MVNIIGHCVARSDWTRKPSITTPLEFNRASISSSLNAVYEVFPLAIYFVLPANRYQR